MSFATRTILVSLSLILIAQFAYAHICMFAPMQRGDMVLDQPGHNSCAHKGPDPCGGVDSMGVVTTLITGQPFLVEFQQNLNHWYGTKPGQLIVQIAKGSHP